MAGKPAQVNTLLQYRFVKKPENRLSHSGESNGSDSADEEINNGIARTASQESTQEYVYSPPSTTTVPESPMAGSSFPSSPTSPVFMSRKVIRPLSVESDESQDIGSSTWLSKQQGKQNHIANGSSSKDKLKKFRRLKAMSESDSDDASPAVSRHSPKEEDTRSRIEKINHLKSMFPIRASSQLGDAVDLFDGNVDQIVTSLMNGKFDRELVDRKRKRSCEESSPPLEGRQFKRVRIMQSSDSIETVSPNSSQSTQLDSQTQDQRLGILLEAFPDKPNEVLLKALEDHNWSAEDAMLALSSRTQNGNDSKTKKKDKKKVSRREEDLSDEDDDYLDDGWDSDDSMEEEEAMGQTEMILSFFEEATVEELTTVPGCSRKKAELIVTQRPFSSWDSLVQKFESTKSLSYNLISGCKETIHVRTIVTKLMKRCEKIAEEMESVVSSLTDPSATGVETDRITKQPDLLSKTFELKPYQMIGLNWLRIMHSQELNGILADEMGLGKTIQAIAFLTHLIEQGDTGPHVIIVPSSTIDNWLREARNWCPSMKVIMYYGSQDERRLVRHRILMDGKRNFNVLLTTYTIATGSVEDRSLFKKCNFHYAVFDEGHMLKNMASLRFQNLMKIRAERRLLLTGTPLQNNLVELMSLLCFVMPELFIGKTEPLKRIFAMISRDDSQGRYEKTRIAQAKRIMKPFLLRRLKSEVLKQLPAKTEEVVRCPMIPDQQELYESLIGQYARQMDNSDSPNGGMSMFMQLRKVANHPLLVRNHYTDEKLIAMSKQIAKEPSHRDRGALPHLIQEDMAVLNDFDINNLCQQYKKYIGSFALDINLISESGKFRMLDDLLEKYENQGDRVLLFSQFVMMLDIMVPYLKEKGIRFLRLDGGTPVPERQKLIDEFNNDPEIMVFLLSTRAGGLGINLTAANVVILHDIDFNPYNDKQAEDRCHRLGQTRSVKIVRLLCRDTVEEGMFRCAQEKLKLERDVTKSDKGENEEDTSDVVSLLKQAFAEYKKKTS
ncbi:SWI/SNF-related matrix-associated actin-dependent regulator of chromatin subfamily A containing DEAD/H box 1 homolog [Haliotis cracherodii]|uniref:SWI/SNF-related matrix-associated actin-dependent regulator of chromatin subfamily A containing DEAD/H box 1 homolog n=1 Tax=Haliotis cracherodii TaxID=6455 RepID=UPI0039ED558C